MRKKKERGRRVREPCATVWRSGERHKKRKGERRMRKGDKEETRGE